MILLKILGVVLFILCLISLIRIGGEFAYSVQGFCIRLRFAGLWIPIYPMKPKKTKKAKKAKPEKEAPTPESTEKGNTWDMIRHFLPLVSDAAGRLKQKIRIDLLALDLTVATGNPASTAIAFGGANAALATMIPILEEQFQIKERRIYTRCNFAQSRSEATLSASFSLTIGQGVALIVYLSIKTLIAFSTAKTIKQKETV